MRRFKKVPKPLNWQYAIGEIVLIFLGITIAVWFNNWNEQQRAKKVEVQTLTEIQNSVRQDLFDIKENLSLVLEKGLHFTGDC